MNPRLRISSLLVGLLLFVLIPAQWVPGLEAKESKGAQVIVKKLDGTIFNGELLDVQGDKLTVLDRSASAEVTASFLEIKEIAKISARLQKYSKKGRSSWPISNNSGLFSDGPHSCPNWPKSSLFAI
jgi:hypothetical protein